MNIVAVIGNGVTITSSMVCMSYLYRFHAGRMRQGAHLVSASIIGVTFLVTGLQFVFPEVLSVLRRDLPGLMRGEWWRVATPLLVQPYGLFQCLFNGAFLLVFLPLAEKLFGNWLLALYLIPGVAGQAVNYLWRPDGGGSSTGIFGVMGALLIYVCRQRSEVPRQYVIFALLGLCGAVALSFVRDGHGPSMLVGAMSAIALRTPPLQMISERPDAGWRAPPNIESTGGK